MKKLLLNDKFILVFILLNAVVLFLLGFDSFPSDVVDFLILIDISITVLFALEIIVKLKYIPFQTLKKSGWFKFDFILVTVSLASVLMHILPFETLDLSFLLVFRLSRVFKMFRFLKFIPNIDELIKGIQRAVKSSILVLFALIIYNFILGVFSSYLFKGLSPTYFGDPLRSIYSIFKIFTVEGWYEIPESVSSNSSEAITFLVIMFFILILISGGILGLSLVNSIFVDAMMADNNDALETKIDELSIKIEQLTNQIDKLTSNNHNDGP
jgi:voltage-gated sodium channel